MLHIEIIGIPRITLGRRIPKKTRALLFYVALQEDARASRIRLANLLWPYQGSESSKHSLRNCLMELRKALRMDGVASSLGSDFVDVWLSNFSTDLRQFHSLCDSGRFAEAVERCRGELFQELEFDSEPFNEWVTAQRGQFAVSSVAAMSRLGSELTTTGQYDEAMCIAEKMIAIDPWNEDPRRFYMRAAALAGRRASAMAHYVAFAKELKTELGTVPDAETIALAREIGRDADRLRAIEDHWRKIDAAVTAGLKPQISPSLIRKTVSTLERERLRRTGAALAA